MQTPKSSRLLAAVVFVAAATAITVEADVDAITRAAAKTTSKIVNVDFNHEFPLLSAVSSWQRKHFGSSPASSRAVYPPDDRRSLVETSFCEFDAEENHCDINPIAVFPSFRPATSAGQILLEVVRLSSSRAPRPHQIRRNKRETLNPKP
jgi:predicted YcjX-like family ATPase